MLTQQPEQISFTEQELNPVTDFYNAVCKAKFELTLPEAAKLTSNAVAFVNLLKKCERHVFEVKAVTKAPAASEQQAEQPQRGRKAK
jgi:hypothetical protein